MQSKNKIPNLVKTAIITLVTITAWLFFDVFKIFNSQPAPQISSNILAPVSPVLNEEILHTLPTRIYINDTEIANINLESLNSSQEAVVASVSSEIKP